MNTNKYNLILASGSPRRKELLEQANYKFQIIPSKSEEIITKNIPSEVVMELATQKSLEVFNAQLHNSNYSSQELPLIVIGADTVVAYNQQILGKPKDALEAKQMLTLLSNQTHQVYTGVSLFYYNFVTGEKRNKVFFEKTDVTFYEMTNEEMDSYIASGDCMDKAGSYGIQGLCAIYIKNISGDYNNVVGLPLARVYHEINELL